MVFRSSGEDAGTDFDHLLAEFIHREYHIGPESRFGIDKKIHRRVEKQIFTLVIRCAGRQLERPIRMVFKAIEELDKIECRTSSSCQWRMPEERRAVSIQTVRQSRIFIFTDKDILWTGKVGPHINHISVLSSLVSRCPRLLVKRVSSFSHHFAGSLVSLRKPLCRQFLSIVSKSHHSIA